MKYFLKFIVLIVVANQLLLFGQSFSNISPTGKIFTTTPKFSWEYFWKYSIGDKINGNIVTNRYVEFRFMMSTIPNGYYAEFMIYNTLSSPSYSSDGGINMVGNKYLTYPLNMYGVSEGPELIIGKTYYCLLFAKEVEYDKNYNIINETGTYAPEFTITIDEQEKVLLLDVLPESSENNISIKSNGRLPVMVQGEADFNISDIDLNTLRFGANSAKFLKSHIEYYNSDEYVDLIMHFDIQNIGLKTDTEELVLIGTTKSGLPIRGVDKIKIVGKLKKETIYNANVNTEISLLQNYPNPFNPTTFISYSIPSRQHVLLKVFDSIGNEVRTLVDDVKEAGDFQIQFDGSNLTNGVYFYQMRAGSFVSTKKFILIK